MRSRSYDREFKLNAINLFRGGMSAAKVCKDLGIPGSTFSGWVRAYERDKEESFKGSGKPLASEEAIVTLMKEIEDVKLERDILKKALAIFSKQK